MMMMMLMMSTISSSVCTSGRRGVVIVEVVLVVVVVVVVVVTNMCYVGRLKGSVYLVNMKLVVRHAAKTWQIRGDRTHTCIYI